MAHQTQIDGLSLAYAYTAQTEAEASDLVAGHACQACGKVGHYISGDKGRKHELADIRYYKVGMRCVCGFVNFVYVVLNDIERATNPTVLSAADALENARQMSLLPDARLEEMLIKTIVYTFTGQMTEAIRIARDCADAFPCSAPAAYNLGYLLMKINDYAASLPYLEKSIELDEKFTASWYQIGIIHQELESYAEAVKSFTNFLQFHPRHTDAMARKRSCESQLSASSEAAL